MHRCETRSLLTDYVWEKHLGAGAFGRVSQCRNRATNDLRAIKIIRSSGGIVGKEFQEAIHETTLQQKAAVASGICKVYGWGTFAGAQ